MMTKSKIKSTMLNKINFKFKILIKYRYCHLLHNLTTNMRQEFFMTNQKKEKTKSKMNHKRWEI